MSKNDKLLRKILTRPKDFTYDELLKLLNSFGCFEDIKGILANFKNS